MPDVRIEYLDRGMEVADEIPVILINEPIFIATGANSDVLYNTYYWRAPYDHFRDVLGQYAAARGWHYLDLWDALPTSDFSDTPLHRTLNGQQRLARTIGDEIVSIYGQ